jgi:hypothetical protein
MVRKKGENVIKKLGTLGSFVLDVCKKTSESPTLDIPYPKTSSSKSGLTKTKFNGKSVMRAIKNINKSEGDEPSTSDK